MKTSLYKRILSALLAIVALAGCVFMVGFTEGDAADAPAVSGVSEVGSEFSQPEQTELPAAETALFISLNSAETTVLELFTHEKVEISAEGLEQQADYQWQILHPERDGLWVNIYDATEKTLPVSAALVTSMLNESGTAALRCSARIGEQSYVSEALTVVLLEEVSAPPAFTASSDPDVLAYAVEEADLADAADSGEPMALADSADPDEGEEATPEFVTVTIEYLQYDFQRDNHDKLILDSEGNPILEEVGKVAFTSYMATLHGGGELKTTVHFPTIVGYDAYWEGDTSPSTEHVFDFDSVTEDQTYQVSYKPALVNYTVRYFFQNIYDDLYVEDSSKKVTDEGYTGATPPDEQLNGEVEGFTPLYYQPDAIAADGSTIFEVYYERNYYLMEFDCNGGYGAETIYVRYGSHISVPDPTKMGYVFGNRDGNGWDLVTTEQSPAPTLSDGVGDTLPATMPPYNSGYKAIWAEIDTVYSVVYWVESSTGAKTYMGSRLVGEISGKTVHGSGDLTASMNICGQSEHTHGTNCVYGCGLVEHTHGVGCNTANCLYGYEHTHSYVNGVCYSCGLTEHATHSRDCYNFAGSAIINTTSSNNYGSYYTSFTVNGTVFEIFRRNYYYNNYYYVKIGNAYYQIQNYGDSINADDLKHTLTCHTHDSSCICNITEEHTHDSYCCSLTGHAHSASCGGCVLDVHTHDAGCKEDELSYMVFDRADQNVTVAGDGSTVVNVYYKWKVFEIRYVFARSKTTNGNTVYQIADTTGNGNVYGGWGTVNVASLPTVDSQYESKSEEYNGYTAHYIAVRAEYGANIESMWPSKAINDVYDTGGRIRRFGSWGAEEGTPYRIAGGTQHANIVGPYPYMSSEMINPANVNTPITDKNGDIYYLAQRMSAWWGDDGTIGDWHGPIDAHAYHIYVEAIDGSGDRTYNGKQYDLLKTHYFYCAHNGSTRVDPFDYTGLKCINDTRGENHVNLDKTTDYQKDSSNYENTAANKNAGRYNCPLSDGCEHCNCFYYDRYTHTLSFVNYNSESVAPTSRTLMYGSSLSNPGTPEYPKGIEPSGYEFKGWYTTPEWYDGTEVNWATSTMPDGDLTLYAKWTPVMRDVIFYSAYSDIAEDENDTSDKVYHFMKAEGIPHGTTLGSTYFDTPEWPQDLDTAINGGELAELYDFVGWFYMDENGKKKFAPDSMEVTRNLVLFAEWQTSVDTTYEVQYVLAADVSKENTPSKTEYSKGTNIAETLFAHSTVGKTKTFNAKGGTDLEPDFRNHFFPTVNSHSILMEQEGAKNTFTFEYVYDDVVYYKVRYVDYATRTEILPSQVFETDKAIVTAKFLPKEGYLPQNYYITKSLAYDGNVDGKANPDSVIAENIITFYYNKDEEHGLYSVEYYLENPDSTDDGKPENYYQYESIVGSDDINRVIEAQIREYEGYTYAPAMNTVITYKANGEVDKTVIGADPPSGTVDYTGLTIKIYYKRNSYPYFIEYREYGAEEDAAPLRVIADGEGTAVENDSAKFDTTVTHEAEALFVQDGITYEYYLDNADAAARTKAMTIRVPVADDPSTGEDETFRNKLVFYYKKHEVTVHYVATCKTPDATSFGGLSFYNERAATSSGLSGSNALPGDGFKFAGWFTDAACTVPVDPSWRYIPGDGTNPDVPNADGTKLRPLTLDTSKDDVYYYALFEPVTTSLTIRKTGMNGTDTSLFLIEGQNKHKYLSLTVAISGDGEAVIADLPVDEYKVTELTAWAWEYNQTGVSHTDGLITVSATANANNVITFTSGFAGSDWLSAESALADNDFS